MVFKLSIVCFSVFDGRNHAWREVADAVFRFYISQCLSCHSVGVDPVSVTHLELQESLVLGIVVESGRHIEVEAVLLETVTAFYAQRYLQVLVERIFASQVKLVNHSLFL